MGLHGRGGGREWGARRKGQRAKLPNFQMAKWAEKGGVVGAFKFDIEGRIERSRYTDRELLGSLRAFARVVGGRRFTAREFQAWRGPRPGSATILKRFGSWRVALGKIGIKGVRGREYPAAELVGALERVWKKMGRPPGAVELARRSGYSINAYKRRWGSVRRACEMVAAYHAGRMTRAELLRGWDGAVRKTIPMDMRWRVMKRDRYRCVVCGASPAVTAGVELHLDHVVPVSKGGRNEDGNLRTLCRECNVGRGVAA